jgi:hypothetical protein
MVNGVILRIRPGSDYRTSKRLGGRDASVASCSSSKIANVTGHLDNEVVGFVGCASVEPICGLANDVVRVGCSVAPELLVGMSKFKKDAYEKEWQDAKTAIRWPYRKGLEKLEPRFWSAVLAQKQAEVDAAKQRVSQEELETKRYGRRVEATPSLLDDPDPHQSGQAVHVIRAKPA